METSISSKKQTKTHRILVKTNSFVRFCEEFMAWQFAFEINWPLYYSTWNFITAGLYIKIFKNESKIVKGYNVKKQYIWKTSPFRTHYWHVEVYVIQTDTQTKKPKPFNSTFFIALSCIMAWDSGVVIDHTLWGKTESRSLTS